jgi:hypothetical protein
MGCETDGELAGLMGLTPGRVSQLRKTTNVDVNYVASLVTKVAIKHAARTLREAIRPIVEFFPIQKSKKRDKGRDIPFDTTSEQGKNLVNHLREAQGLYSFYNSQAEIIYLGKTEKLNLYGEMINAYNRELPNYLIYRVRHPWGKYRSSSTNELRKIRKENVSLRDTASFFSAYSVKAELIGTLEALLIRMAPNYLINARIESKDMAAFGLGEI